MSEDKEFVGTLAEMKTRMKKDIKQILSKLDYRDGWETLLKQSEWI